MIGRCLRGPLSDDWKLNWKTISSFIRCWSLMRKFLHASNNLILHHYKSSGGEKTTWSVWQWTDLTLSQLFVKHKLCGAPENALQMVIKYIKNCNKTIAGKESIAKKETEMVKITIKVCTTFYFHSSKNILFDLQFRTANDR